jgi:hypothetical protein
MFNGLAQMVGGLSVVESAGHTVDCQLFDPVRALIDLGLIHAVLVGVVLAMNLHIAQYFFGVGAGHFQCGHPVNNVDCQAKRSIWFRTAKSSGMLMFPFSL